MASAIGLKSEETIANITKADSVSVEELEHLGVKRRMIESKPKQESHTSFAITRQEIKRRIMWSCFILDRYMSSGRSREQMSAETLRIQLPCSDVDFQFRRNVKTEFLYPEADFVHDERTTSTGQSAKPGYISILGSYIRLVEIWGRISQWSCAGGRRSIFEPDLIQSIAANDITDKKSITHHGMSKPNFSNYAKSLMTSRNHYHQILLLVQKI
jgi:hypothetical protein